MRLASMRIAPLLVTTALPLALGLSTLAYRGYGHQWWRGHAGDALVVAFLVGLLGAITRWPLRHRMLLVAAVATGLELSQLATGAASRNAATRLFLGSHFDAFDFVYYAAGLGLAAALAWRQKQQHVGCETQESQAPTKQKRLGCETQVRQGEGEEPA